MGHFEPYRTHYLRATDSRQAATLEEVPPVEMSVSRFFDLSKRWENDQPGSVIEFEGSVLERSGNSAGRNPYLLIRVDQNLINNHNDISDPRIAAFVQQLILIASQSTNPDERLKKRDRGLTK